MPPFRMPCSAANRIASVYYKLLKQSNREAKEATRCRAVEGALRCRWDGCPHDIPTIDSPRHTRRRAGQGAVCPWVARVLWGPSVVFITLTEAGTQHLYTGHKYREEANS
eukprot:1161635-Pelagomonas_calceolata.AAC.3